MKTTLATTSVRQDHPPQPVPPATPFQVRRIGPIDRAALHLGVALIKWGRRPITSDPRSTRRLTETSDEAQRQREDLRDELLSLPLFR